ncbi:MAG: LdpA C-terminal domain-containing domain, partial [Cyanobacteria bacterium P01_H01_bin.130]
MPSIRSFVLAYGLEGADCIDVAAEPAVVAAALAGLNVCERLGGDRWSRPWLMVSVNDGDDPHFRTAYFDADRCPADCPRPCERVCPTAAIAPTGVTEALCYGCGRCMPICPHGLIEAVTYQRSPQDLPALVLEMGVDALEIHTQVGHAQQFQTLWRSVKPYLSNLKLVAVSCPRERGAIAYLTQIWDWVAADVQRAGCAWLWQADGRPMSGDIGRGTTHAAIAYGREILRANLPGFIQLAGGTNQATVGKLHQQGLVGKIAGVAYGGYGRSQLKPILDQLDHRETQRHQTLPLESQPDLFQDARTIARQLI